MTKAYDDAPEGENSGFVDGWNSVKSEEDINMEEASTVSLSLYDMTGRQFKSYPL